MKYCREPRPASRSPAFQKYVSSCGEYDPVVTITPDGTPRDVVVFISNEHYELLSVTGFGGQTPLSDSNGTLATVDGQTGYLWHYGELSSPATLYLHMKGRCFDNSFLSAEVFYNLACTDLDFEFLNPGTTTECNDSATASGGQREPTLEVVKFPEIIYAEAVQGQRGLSAGGIWGIKVINPGATTAYSVEVVESIGDDLILSGGRDSSVFKFGNGIIHPV